MRAGVRATVQAAITQPGYVPHGAARALASRRSGTIGTVVPTLENSLFAKGIQSLQIRLATEGITLLLASSNYDLDHEVREIRALVSRGVDALVLVGISHRPEVYTLLAQKSIPYVHTWSVDRQGIHPCVGIDNERVAYRITQYRLDLASQRPPSLTTAHVPADAMGKAAAEYLLAKINGATIPECTELEVRLIVRDTTGPPANKIPREP